MICLPIVFIELRNQKNATNFQGKQRLGARAQSESETEFGSGNCGRVAVAPVAHPNTYRRPGLHNFVFELQTENDD